MADQSEMNKTVHPASQIPWSSTSDEFDELWEGHAKESIPDILETMFAQQLKHMQAYSEIGHTTSPEHWGNLDSRVTQASIREFAGYTVEELYEAINHLKNKPWKQTDKPTDVPAFMEELADMWHFLIELHIIAGVTPIDVFKVYFRKAFINGNRIQTGY